MANFKRLSRYTGGVVAENRTRQQFLVLRRPLQLEPADGDVFVTVNQELIKRPDLIANNAYGNVNLWWVIYEFNNIRDPLNDLREGQILRIPELQRVLQAIEELEDQ